MINKYLKEEFKMALYHPDEDKWYLIESIKDYKMHREDSYRWSIEEGGNCTYIYFNDYTKQKVKELNRRQLRYWKNKEIENIRSKIWRLNKKLEKLENKEEVEII